MTKKKLMKRTLAFILAVAVCLAFIPTAMAAEGEGEGGNDPVQVKWETSKSKIATPLDENDISNVTLSLPAAEENLSSDIVFVLDKSSCEKFATENAEQLLDALLAAKEENEASIKVAVVSFRDAATYAFELQELTKDNKDDVITAIKKRPDGRGTDIEVGLVKAKEILDDDDAVKNQRKHVILISDGLARSFLDQDGKNQMIYAQLKSGQIEGGPSGWSIVRNGGEANYAIPGGNWNDYWNKVKAWVEKDKDTYSVAAPSSVTDLKKLPDWESASFVPSTEWNDHALCIDRAMYEAWKAYEELKSEGYHCYTQSVEDYPVGQAFLNMLNGEESLDFNSIKNDILYLLDNESKVEDYIGYDEKEGYNFDFVNDSSALTIKVGDDTYPAKKIDGNKYGFAPHDTDAGIEYDYTVTYEAGDGKTSEHFVWTINVPVSNFAPVSLTYQVKLVEKSDVPGEYTVYTNQEATLTPKDSNGNQGTPETFDRPGLKYTVPENPNPPTPPTPPTPPRPPVDIDDPDVPLDLNGADHFAYIEGYPDGTVQPGGNITRAEVSTMIYRLLTEDRRAEIFTDQNDYSDVEKPNWFNKAVSSMTVGKYVTGYPDGTFLPNQAITRAEFVTIVVRFLDGMKESENPFSDIDGHWAKDYILSAVDAGWIDGYPDGTFQPNKAITRAEAMKIMNTILHRGVNETSELGKPVVFPDNSDASQWYYYEVIEATNDHETEGERPDEQWKSNTIDYTYDIEKYERP